MELPPAPKEQDREATGRNMQYLRVWAAAGIFKTFLGPINVKKHLASILKCF